MKTLESKLSKAQNEYEALLSVAWWNLSKDEEDVHASKLQKATANIEELQRRIACTKEVRLTAKSMKSNTFF